MKYQSSSYFRLSLPAPHGWRQPALKEAKNLNAIRPLYSRSLHKGRHHCQRRAEVTTLAEFITARFTDVDCRVVFTSFSELNARFNVDSDVVLVRFFSLEGAPQQVVLTSLRPRFLHPSHYSFSAGYAYERLMCDSVRK